jgi:hypothetical protein
VERPARMALEPFLDLRMLVSGVVVDDGVDGLALGNGGFCDIQKSDELLMPVTLVNGGEKFPRIVGQKFPTSF